MSVSQSPNKMYFFQAPPKIVFGINSIETVGVEAKQFGGKKILLVSDEIIAKLGLVDKVKRLLEKEGFTIEVFDKVEAEPSIATAEKVTTSVREEIHDSVVGIGGGSVMDIAKIAAIMARNSGEIKEYATSKPIKEPGIPKILIPTTSGTGSEASQAAIITLSTKQKSSLSNRYLFADVAIVDPVLATTMPPKVTASTGIDALSHAVEALMSTNSTPITDALSLEAVRLVSNNLRMAYAQGDNLEARSNMSWAALLGGMVLYARVVYAHSFGYTIGPKYGIPHGLSCGLGLPYVMDYNLPACVDKFLSIANAMGEQVKGLPKLEGAFKAIVAVKELIEDVGLPSSLKETGVPKAVLPILADELVNFYPRPNNPKQITKKEAMELYEKAWEGRIGKRT